MLRKIAPLLLALALLAPVGAEAKVLQEKRLVATGTVKTWTSKVLPPGTFAYLYAGKKELPQRYINKCLADYAGAGMIARLVATRCDDPKTSVYRFNYASAAGRQPFRVVLIAP
jgi:hypothetical protein